MEEVIINLTDVIKYDECIKNILLYWYKDYITLYDGVNEIMIKKSEIASIYNKYKSENSVFNRYTSSRVIITCKNGLVIKVDISGSPQDSSSPKGYIKKEVIDGTYVFLNNIKTYSNGANATVNSYYDTDGNVYKIDGLNFITYFKRMSFYDTLKSIGVSFNYSNRNDYNSSFLIDGRYIGSITGSLINNNSVANISGCVFKYECDIGFDLNSTNIVSWIDQINNIKLEAYPSAIFSTDLYTSNSLKTITSTSGAKQLLANKISFSEYGYNKDTDSITVCWIGGGCSIQNRYNFNEIITIGDDNNHFKIYIESAEFDDFRMYKLHYAATPLIFESRDVPGTFSNSYNICGDINIIDQFINTIAFHCVTITRINSTTGILKYYFNGYLVNTIQSVPYKINNGCISLSCKTKILDSLSQYFGNEYPLYHAGFYMFNKSLSDNEITTLYDYTQSILGYLPSNLLNGDYAGIYNLQSDYGVILDSNNNVSLWNAKCNRTIIQKISKNATYSFINNMGEKAVTFERGSIIGNAEITRAIITSTNPAYSLYSQKGNQYNRTMFIVSQHNSPTFSTNGSPLIFNSSNTLNIIENQTNIIAFTAELTGPIVNSELDPDISSLAINTYLNDINTITSVTITSSLQILKYRRSNIISFGYSLGIHVYAVIVFDYVLNNTELNTMFNYLRTKYITL